MKKTTSYIIYGFKKSELTLNDWDRIKDIIPWSNINTINGETIIGPSLSKVENSGFNDNVDVKFDTLSYLKRIFQEFIVKEAGIYIPDSLFRVIHMTIEEFD